MNTSLERPELVHTPSEDLDRTALLVIASAVRAWEALAILGRKGSTLKHSIAGKTALLDCLLDILSERYLGIGRNEWRENIENIARASSA